MAVLKIPDDVDNETIIQLQDVFDTFVPRDAEGETIEIKNGVFNFNNTNTIVYVVTPPLPSA
jgi:hypothetical protein